MVSFDQQYDDGCQRHSTEDALVGGRDAIDGFAGLRALEVSLSTEHSSIALAKGGDQTENDSGDQLSLVNFGFASRTQGHTDSHQDHETEDPFVAREFAIQPKPFDQCR